MYSESRKAARDSFADHRAQLLFSPGFAVTSNDNEPRTELQLGRRRSPEDIVRNGLLRSFKGAA